MTLYSISTNKIILHLHSGTSAIRLSDSNGNQFRKPTQCKISAGNYVEWMITNKEISEMVNSNFDSEDRKQTLESLDMIKDYIKQTRFATREAVKITVASVGNFKDFEIFEYTEHFYSFEKELSSKIRIRITFKMGDYTLAPHLFVLLPFNHKSVKIMNREGEVVEGNILGGGGYAQWIPEKEDMIAIIVALAHASESHKADLKDILLK